MNIEYQPIYQLILKLKKLLFQNCHCDQLANCSHQILTRILKNTFILSASCLEAPQPYPVNIHQNFSTVLLDVQ